MLVELLKTISERDKHLVNLNQAVAERDRQLVNLNQAVAERDRQLVDVNHAVVERDLKIMSLVSSNSWRLTKPLRFLGRLLRGEFKAAITPFTGTHAKNVTKIIRQARNAAGYVIRGDFDGLIKRIRARKTGHCHS